MHRRTLNELINIVNPAWPLIQDWIEKARNSVEVLLTERRRGEEVLLHLQVTTRSPMGAMALETGGMFIDHGWLRFLGSGCERMRGNLQSWNSETEKTGHYPLQNALVIAHDVVGGFFALNGGAFPGELGTAFYFAPDTLQWENTHKSYSGLLEWAICGDVDVFYESMRWPDWEQEVASLTGDQGISIYPFLFLEKGISVAERSRCIVPIDELWNIHLDLARHLTNLPAGTPIQFLITDDAQDKG